MAINQGREKTLADFVFLPKEAGNTVQLPDKITGDLVSVVYRDYRRAREQFGNNLYFKLELQGNELVGSTLQDSALINQIVSQYGVRTLLPSDLQDMRIAEMIKRKHYVDTLGIVLRGSTAKIYDEREKNIFEYLGERVDVTRLEKTPALVTNLRVIPTDDL
ncbi:hypothetical protein HYV50_01170 [Candidatus Pacearchaeota archaeon]|nr:hypothetical protein [Candidatus Pacearchaeota archaeon]